MRKFDFKKITLVLEIASFISFIVALIVDITKFLRIEGVIEITTFTMDKLIKMSIISFIILFVILILSLIIRIILVKIGIGEDVDAKLIADRTIFACIIFMIILFFAFYYLNIYNTQYNIFEFLKTL